jgi:hypothetical protein
MRPLLLEPASALVRVIWVAPAASIAATIVFALAIRGFTRYADMRLAGRERAAVRYAALAAGGTVVFLASVAYAVILVAQKG